ncbi:MAG: cytochrome P450 [Pseudomonadota bacterium]
MPDDVIRSPVPERSADRVPDLRAQRPNTEDARADRGPDALYRPPAPFPASPLGALFRAISSMERDLITLLPGAAYREPIFWPGYSRRGIYVVNEPALVAEVLGDARAFYPKNELMVGALAPLVGDGIFISEGAVWERQRRMIDPAFAHMRINQAFQHMAAAMADAEARFDRAADAGDILHLEAELSHLTADIMFRTIFSKTFTGELSLRVFEAFARFQKACANVSLRHLLLTPSGAEIRQPRAAQTAAAEIRSLVDQMLETRLALEPKDQPDDIARDIIAARDPETGAGFTRDEMLDQLAVFFLAGHETTASSLTWSLFILAEVPEIAARVRAEVAETCGDGSLTAATVKRLAFTRNVFRETLRLYPAVTFLAREAREARRLGPVNLPKGAMLLVSPWVIQRHEALWPNADRFDPDRFAPGREDAMPQGAYLPFGQGARLCVGVAFAMMEAGLIIAAMLRRYRIEALEADRVRPVARLTTRPAREIAIRLHRR